jgi:hypothetical protein
MALNTRMGHISALASFFQETAAWNYPDVPGRLLISPGDMPKRPHRVPRFIPQDELGFPISFTKFWGLSKIDSLQADMMSHLISPATG